MSHRKCLFCDSLYQGLSNFMQHIKRKHMKNMENVSKAELKVIKEEWQKKPRIQKKKNRGKFLCDICGSNFGMLKNVRAHMASQHGGNKLMPMKCGFANCSSYATHKNNYIVHIKEKHITCCKNTKNTKDFCILCSEIVKQAIKMWFKN